MPSLKMGMADLIELRRSEQSTLTGFASLMGWFLLACGVAYLYDGENEHIWWSAKYIVSLAIPAAVLPAVVWLGFVPKRIRYSRDTLEFTSRLFGVQMLPLSELRHWGFGRGVLLLEFEKSALPRRTLQIALSFYPQQSRTEFLKFLESAFAERKTSVWWGIQGVSSSR